MVLPYKPRPIDHQPHIYTPEERQAAVLTHRRQVTQGSGGGGGGGGGTGSRGGGSKERHGGNNGGKAGKGESRARVVAAAVGGRAGGGHALSGGTDDSGDGDNSGSALSITALKTLDCALHLVESFQSSANSELEARAKTLLFQNQQITSRLEALRGTAQKLQQHAPSLHSGESFK
jgi:hypothetical protein